MNAVLDMNLGPKLSVVSVDNYLVWLVTLYVLILETWSGLATGLFWCSLTLEQFLKRNEITVESPYFVTATTRAGRKQLRTSE